MSSEDKLEVENQIESLREALKGSDMEAVKAGMSALAETLQRVSTRGLPGRGVIRRRLGNGTSDGTGDGAERFRRRRAEAPRPPAEEETVEGEFKEV